MTDGNVKMLIKFIVSIVRNRLPTMVLTLRLLIKRNEKRIKLMALVGYDSQTENDDSSSDELLRYKMEMEVPESINPLQW